MNNLKIYKTKSFLDSRGTFARIFDIANPELAEFSVKQVNVSHNPITGTLRGMHFQLSGPPEDKIVSLLSGSVFVAIVDLRPNSPKYLQKTEINISSPMQAAIYIPSGYATGWITTSPDTTLQYLMSARFEECTYSGFRYDDSICSISWPTQPILISEQDRNWPNFIIDLKP